MEVAAIISLRPFRFRNDGGYRRRAGPCASFPRLGSAPDHLYIFRRERQGCNQHFVVVVRIPMRLHDARCGVVLDGFQQVRQLVGQHMPQKHGPQAVLNLLHAVVEHHDVDAFVGPRVGHGAGVFVGRRMLREVHDDGRLVPGAFRGMRRAEPPGDLHAGGRQHARGSSLSPISAVLTSASVHNSQVAIPLATMSTQRVTYCYELMDGAYDAAHIQDDSRCRGHIPIIDPAAHGQNPRPLDWAQQQRYQERTMVERVNARLKDEFGARNVRVRGAAKVMAHLMLGVLALTADQLLRLCPGGKPW